MVFRTKQADKSTEIDSVVGEVIRQRRSGVAVDESAVEAKHAHLMPELGGRLRALRNIEAAGCRALAQPWAAGSSADASMAVEDDFEFLHNALTDYVLLERLHRGGQGIVYKAVQRSTDRIVALKVLLHGPLASDRQRRRFAREVDLVARLRHPHIVTLFDCGEVRGLPYFAMEFIDGLPVDDYALVNAPTARATMELFGPICRAVHAAHQYGIIHRDLKPSNVLVDADGEPHVLDFGLAKDLMPPVDSGEVSLASLPGQVVGTLPYLSPEQIRGPDVEVDTRADVYALGVMLYELLTETFPYPVFGDCETVRQNILAREPTRMRATLSDIDTRLRPGDIDNDLEAIVLKALEKEPARRYQSAAALADDIARWLTGDAVEARADRKFYLLKKTLRKYRIQVAVSAAFVALLAAGLIGMTVLWQRAERDARTYQAGLQMGMYTRLGGHERDGGDLDQAIAMFQKAIAIGDGLTASDVTIQRLRYSALHELAELQYRSGKSDEAEPFAIAAIAIAEDSFADADNAHDRRLLALSYTLRARIAAAMKNWDVAASEYAKAMVAYRGLIAKHPDNDGLAYELAVLCGEQGRAYQGALQFESALASYKCAHEIYVSLVAAKPHSVGYVLNLARTEARIAVLYLHQKSSDDDATAATWLMHADRRLHELLDSENVHGREQDINRVLGQIESNTQLIARRHAKRATAAAD